MRDLNSANGDIILLAYPAGPAGPGGQVIVSAEARERSVYARGRLDSLEAVLSVVGGVP